MSSPPRLNPSTFPAEGVIGNLEAAALLDLRPRSLRSIKSRDSTFPDPVWTVAGNPAYLWCEVLAWAGRTGRVRTTKLRNAHARIHGTEAGPAVGPGRPKAVA